jgi:hypothetical protein
MPDNSRFVGAVVGARQFGFDPGVIVEKLSNVEVEYYQRKSLLRITFLKIGRVRNFSPMCDSSMTTS